MTQSERLLKHITDHLSQPNNIVQVGTSTRSTLYRAKHIGWFSASTRADDRGVWVNAGNSKVYVLPETLRFGHICG